MCSIQAKFEQLRCKMMTTKREHREKEKNLRRASLALQEAQVTEHNSKMISDRSEESFLLFELMTQSNEENIVAGLLNTNNVSWCKLLPGIVTTPSLLTFRNNVDSKQQGGDERRLSGASIQLGNAYYDSRRILVTKGLKMKVLEMFRSKLSEYRRNCEEEQNLFVQIEVYVWQSNEVHQ